MAQRGQIKIRTATYRIQSAERAYDDMRAGHLTDARSSFPERPPITDWKVAIALPGAL